MDEAAPEMKKKGSGLHGLVRHNRRTTALSFAAIVIIAWAVWPKAEEPPPRPTTITVVRGDIESTVATSGMLGAGGSVDVGAQVSGQLNKLHVKLGDVVSEGDLIAEIDSFIPSQRVASQEANVEALQANTAPLEVNLELARGNLARQERLMKALATTEVEYDGAILRLAQAKASLTRHYLQMDQAKASLEEARERLSYTRISAPVAGTIVKVLTQEGQTLNATQATPIILQIGDLSTIRVIAKVPEADVARLSNGMEAYFTTASGGNRRWQARLLEISLIPEASRGLGSLTFFDAFLEVDNRDGALLPGMGAKVYFLLGLVRNVVKVPLGALALTSEDDCMSAAGQWALANADGPMGLRGHERFRGSTRKAGEPAQSATVQIIDAEGIVQTREVQVGFSNNVEAEVLSGLAAGERVVSGLQRPVGPNQRFPSFKVSR